MISPVWYTKRTKYQETCAFDVDVHPSLYTISCDIWTLRSFVR